MMELEKILQFNRLAKEEGERYRRPRPLLKTLKAHKDRTLLGLCGPRGAGKTILLKQLLVGNESAIYISLDLLPADTDIFDLVKALNENYRVDTFLLDEVHFNPEINRHLKAAFDLLRVRIVFTSSVALKMFESAHDLSRRVRLLRVPYLSFREYLSFRDAADLNLLSMSEILSGEVHSRYLLQTDLFHEYLNGGMLPFALEVREWKEALTNVLHKIIDGDLPRIHSLTLAETQKIFKVVSFIGRSAVDGINPTSVAKNVGITRYKADQYLTLLAQAFIVQQVFPRGTNVLREPKVLLTPPYRLLFQEFEAALGGLREDFAVDALGRCGLVPKYLKSTRGEKTPDYTVKVNDAHIILEIGGASKGRAQFNRSGKKYSTVVFKDGAPYDKDGRALALLGFLT